MVGQKNCDFDQLYRDGDQSGNSIISQQNLKTHEKHKDRQTKFLQQNKNYNKMI